MKKITNYISKLLADRTGNPNTKLHFGSLFAIFMIIALFCNVDNGLYNTFAICMLGLFGCSVADNLTSPKIEINKTETTTKESKTSIDVAETIKTIKGKGTSSKGK